MSSDQYDLDRFLGPQLRHYHDALLEIRAGEKTTHWMWFIFPQFDGLGSSPNAKLYAIKSLDEARAYLDHPVLGPRLIEIAQAAADVTGHTAEQIFGPVDAMKFQSSATLFAAVSPKGSVFEQLLDKYFDGKRDQRTLELLKR